MSEEVKQVKRKQISKRVRFEVFKRDGFKCQYCGAVPPDVVLHVDHINPVVDGGSNEIDNLVTACEPCNLGKGAVHLSDIPKSLKDKAEEVAEREDQIKGYNAVLQEKANRLENESWVVASAIECVEQVDSFNRADLISIKRFLEKLSFVEVIEAASLSFAKVPYSRNRRFRYFCAVCWNKIREAA